MIPKRQTPTADSPAILWWSGGITSAVACKIALEDYGKSNCRVVFIDTFNEDDDTYRFKSDCEAWYGVPIEGITALNVPGYLKYGNYDYTDIEDVWRRYLSLNVATGAICSAELKRTVRTEFQKANTYSCQVFGFDCDPGEVNRARNLKKNYPKSIPAFPLIENVLTKRECIKMVQDEGIAPPRAYTMGLNNNNCLKRGCVQGGIGYWQLMRTLDLQKFNRMAEIEHELTDLKGSPVTMLKDQGKDGGLVFLLPHPAYPHVKDLSMMKGRPPKPLMECNGMCSLEDGMDANPTREEINFDSGAGKSQLNLFGTF